jgi:hypothetical protein
MDMKWLVGLYPERWRARYGDEFRALLEEEPASPSLLIDVIRGALHAHAAQQPAGVIPMRSRTLTATSLLAVLLVVPSLTFLAAAMVRLMQPTQYQPAHAAQVIFDAFVALPAGWSYVLLWFAPVVALALSGLVVWRRLTSDASTRADVSAFVEGLRRLARQPALVVAAVAFLGSAGVLLFAVGHLIAG